ncbi:MAG: hypothetical protein GX621_12105 [Pirellulaceae bacterium]|nr:hypothetical protein [Pirellulaceae bacterium]
MCALCSKAACAFQVEAVAGEPFGVGRITIPNSPDLLPAELGVQGVSISTPDGRILYPVVELPPDNKMVTEVLLGSPLMKGGPVREQAGGILRELLKPPPQTNLYFLFHGSEPLEVTLQTRGTRRFVVRPWANPPVHNRLLRAWWRAYTAKSTGFFRPSGSYPPVVSNYLQAMLARRLGLPPAESDKEKSWQDQLEGQLGLFLGTEDVRLAVARDRMLGRLPSGEIASLALPAEPDWPPLELPEPADDVKTEPIANRVPAECLYVRFGSFANFLWLQDTLQKWGGDMSNLVALRGLDTGQSARMERQLVLKQTALSRMLGPTVISDVAIVGTDMFMREGGAFGILFEARNSFLLENDFKRQRAERVRQGGVAEETVEIAGQKVSLLSSPDGTVRSFYLANKGYIFVTTSETLMRRFIETGGEGASLGRSAEFRHARSVMPLSREDTVFVYLSDAFFRNMAGPRYWIEILRRLRAAADIELLEMASLASATEGKPGDTIEQLVAGGFLPPEFGPRGDGSRAELLDGAAIDSPRGRRGAFLPIPDVPVEKVTPSEAAAYRKFLDFYHAEWGRLDPMLVGIKRHEPKDDVERIVLDVRANPFARRHFDRLSEWIGPADKERLAPIPGDLMAFEAQLVNQRLFGGLRDFELPFDVVGGEFKPSGGMRNMLVGYIGTTGQLGFLSLLDQRIGARSGSRGIVGEDGLLYRYGNERFTLFSLNRQVLAEVHPQLRFVEAERPAQIRLHVDDVSRARLASGLAAMSYTRTLATSRGNLLLLHAMREQLHVPGPDCKAAAELILDARLICPLGGQYEYRENADGSGYWTSTALEMGANGVPLAGRLPANYRDMPPLNWFRGMEMEATMTDSDLSARVEVFMRMPDKPIPSEAQPETVPTPPPVRPGDAGAAESATEEEKPAKKPGGWFDALRPRGGK